MLQLSFFKCMFGVERIRQTLIKEGLLTGITSKNYEKRVELKYRILN